MVLKKYMISAYGKLVLAGVYTLDENKTGKKLVPKPYQEAVTEWLAEREEKRSRTWNSWTNWLQGYC